MSTETPDPPKKSKKSHKHKSSTSDSPKKRRRDEPSQQEAENEVIPDSQPTKRHKKDKTHKHKHKHKHHTPDPPLASSSTPLSPEKALTAHSPFIQQTSSLYLPLSACAFNAPLQGLCAEHISPLLLTYSPQLRGVVLGYENARISESAREGVAGRRRRDDKRKEDREEKVEGEEQGSNEPVLARSVDEYGVAYLWLTADFLLFRPRKGTFLEGFVSLQNESMLGMICYNYFNAGIEREKLPPEWKWVEEKAVVDEGGMGEAAADEHGDTGGYFVDGSGKKVEGRLVFRVEDFEATGDSEFGAGSVSIIGTLLPEERRS